MLWPPSPASCYFSSMKWLRSSWFSLILGIISIRRSGALAHVTCSKTNWSEVLAHVNTALSVVQFEIGSRFRKWDGRHLNTYRWVFFFQSTKWLTRLRPSTSRPYHSYSICYCTLRWRKASEVHARAERQKWRIDRLLCNFFQLLQFGIKTKKGK